jgi:hypothetical protein
MNQRKQQYSTVRIWVSTYDLLKKQAEERQIPKTQLLRELVEAYEKKKQRQK